MRSNRTNRQPRGARSLKSPLGQFEALEDRRLLSVSAELLRDVNFKDTTGQGSSPSDFVSAGAITYFSASMANGTTVTRELFKTDGTEAGTGLVVDLPGNPNPTRLFAIGQRVYFAASEAGVGTELWISDGTAVGTRRVADIRLDGQGSLPEPIGSIGETLYFSADDGVHGRELWSTDGTEAGTRLVRDILPGTASGIQSGVNTDRRAAVVDDRLLFWAKDADHGLELWVSDGSLDGTQMLNDSMAGVDGQFSANVIFSDGAAAYYSAAQSTTGRELWTTDGTPAGTHLIADLFPGSGGSDPNEFALLNSTLYFTARDSNDRGSEMWRLGEAGPELFLELAPGAASGSPFLTKEFGGKLIFFADDGLTGRELWTSDGTVGGTHLLKEIVPGAESPLSFNPATRFVEAGGMLFFYGNDQVHGNEVFRTDGTADGTLMLGELRPGAANPFLLQGSPPIGVAGDGVVFLASEGVRGFELWQSDGTVPGTRLLKDIRPGSSSSYPQWLFGAGSTLFFTADDGDNGYELWASDGSRDSTRLVKEAIPGAGGGGFYGGASLNGVAIMGAGDEAHGAELWRSDGTAAGTYLLKDIQPGVSSSNPSIWGQFGNAIYVITGDGFDRALWKTDGTIEGTQKAFGDVPVPWKDLNTIAMAGDKMYFVALYQVAENQFDERIWVTDGTLAGTHVLPDVNPDPQTPNAGIAHMREAGGLLYFRVAHQLWRTDGTNDGTFALFDGGPSDHGANAEYFGEHQGEMFYAANYDGGRALFKSDGTREGTQLVEAQISGEGGASVSLYPTNLVSVGEYVYFIGSDETGSRVWRSDGTEAGTVRIIDALPGVADLNSGFLVDVRGTLFFNALMKNGNTALYKSDGTMAGTERVGEFLFQAGATPIRDLTAAGPNVYFTAQSPAGREPWVIRGTPGDTNFDGVVDLVDLNNVRNHFGETGNVLGDADGNGAVDLADLNSVRNNFGAASSAPVSSPGRAPIRSAETTNAPAKNAVPRSSAMQDALFGSALVSSENPLTVRKARQFQAFARR